ncbi:MAG: nitroreductase family protein, partial [Candidatus Hermodarchaeota archaeon]
MNDNIENEQFNRNNHKIDQTLLINGLKFNKSITDIIRKRVSIRSYNNKPLNTEIREEVSDIIKNQNFNSPFLNKGFLRFELINLSELNQLEATKNNSIGGILGAQDFIIGVVEKTKNNFEHYGYVFESIILKLKELELGTFWLGI